MSISIEDVSASGLVSAEDLAELTDLTAYLYAQLGLSAAVELSLPMDELRPGSPEAPVSEGTLGDIVLCPAVAQAQAEAAGHSITDELCLLTTHAVLHLLGYDHDDAAERAQMFGLQKQLLEQFLGREAPVPTTD
mgnify:CR=1 FL=1